MTVEHAEPESLLGDAALQIPPVEGIEAGIRKGLKRARAYVEGLRERDSDPQASQPPALKNPATTDRMRSWSTADLAELRELSHESHQVDSPEDNEAPARSLLSDPMLLASLAIPAAIVFIVTMLTLFGGGNRSLVPDDALVGQGVLIVPVAQASARVEPVVVRSLAVATLREGPSLTSPSIASLPYDRDVELVGRDVRGFWLLVQYPVGATTNAWVPTSAVNVSQAALESLTVVSTTPR